MPGFEIINSKESNAVNRLFKKENGILFAHGFDNLRKNYHVREFEQNFNRKLKSKYTLAVSSGTSAIKIALLSIGVKRGDEVITQAFNFIATVETIDSNRRIWVLMDFLGQITRVQVETQQIKIL